MLNTLNWYRLSTWISKLIAVLLAPNAPHSLTKYYNRMKVYAPNYIPERFNTFSIQFLSSDIHTTDFVAEIRVFVYKKQETLVTCISWLWSIYSRSMLHYHLNALAYVSDKTEN